MDFWDLPGGMVESGEAPWDAAVRETREEVGLSVVVKRLTEITWRPSTEELNFTFECSVVGGEIGLSDEADDVAYFDPDRLPTNVSPAKRDRILAVVAGPDQVRLRSWTGPSMRELAAKGQLQ